MNSYKVFLESRKMIGYKVMRTKGNKAISGMNSRLSLPLKKGAVAKFPEQGIFVTPHKQYALDYYSGLSPDEVLLTFEFDPSAIISGDPTDREPELGVGKATLINWEFLEEED